MAADGRLKSFNQMDQAKLKESRFKDNARRKANYLVESGKIKVPDFCEKCGDKPQSFIRGNGRPQRGLEMHHPDHNDYARIIWLCRACHHKLHGRRWHDPQHPASGTMWAHNAYGGKGLKIKRLKLS